MIKINKFENVFGIKKLVGANSLDKLNVIYSPNGTAKSSISDALERITIGDSIDDVYGSGLAPSYELIIDGLTYDENDDIEYRIIKYSGLQPFELSNPDQYEPLVISESLKQIVESSKKAIDGALQRIDTILLSSFKKAKGRGTEKYSKKMLDLIKTIAKTQSEDHLILDFIKNIQLNAKPLLSSINEEDVYSYISSTSRDLLSNPIIKQELNEYAQIVTKEITSSILDSKFDVYKLDAFYNHAVEDNYFDEDLKRQLFINGETCDKESFKRIRDEENAKVFGSEEAKAKIDQCKKVIDKKAGNQKLSNMLVSDLPLLARASDFESFINEVFVTFVGQSVVKGLELERNIINAEQAKLESLREKFDDSDNKINSIWEQFRNRFRFEKFELKIKNRFDAVIGFEVPKFVKCQPNTDCEIDDPADLRFSTGEIRSFNLINVIIEIELARLNNEPFTLILDDAVESFDYKNKYGIIDYLVEIKDDPNIQLIAFTHNFDFYRTAILAFGKSITNQYFMYKDIGNVVTLYDARANNYYLSVCDFNMWKNNPNYAKYFSFIPFGRNVLQLQSNGSNSDVCTINKYMHYDLNQSETLTFNDLNNVLHPKLACNMPRGCLANDKFLKKLYDETVSILSLRTINETDIEYKLTLGLFIRLFTERFLANAIKDRCGVSLGVNSSNNSAYLIREAKTRGCLSNDELLIITRANIVAPSCVHANSFMYEPLIDVDSSPLIEIVNELIRLNSSWPL